MKRLVSLSLILALLCCLCGCITINIPPSDNQQTPAEPVDNTEFDLTEFITDDYVQTGEYTDSFGNTTKYSYRIPVINSDKDNAKYINDEIQDYLYNVLDICNDAMDADEFLFCDEINWECFEDDGLVSIIAYANKGYEKYFVFNYVPESDELLDNASLCYRYLFDTFYLSYCLHKTAARAYDKSADEFTGPLYITDYTGYRALTLGKANIDDVKLYMQNGRIYGVFAMNTIAGDEYHANLEVIDEPLEEEGAPAQCNCDKIWSMLRSDNSVSISFEPPYDEQDNVLADYADLSQSYEVSGAYQCYADMYMGRCGVNETPYLFLLTDDGKVEFVDIYGCLMSDGNLYSSGPLSELSAKIIGFDYTETVNEQIGKQTVYAYDNDGNQYDLSDYVDSYERNVQPKYLGKHFINLPKNFLSLTINPDMTAIAQFAPAEVYYDCSFIRLGVTEDGEIYGYHIQRSDSYEVNIGTVCVVPDEENNDMFIISFHCGNDVLDFGEGNSYTVDCWYD